MSVCGCALYIVDVFASAEGTARALYDSHMDNGVQFCKVAAAGNMEFGMLRVEPGSEKRVGNVQSKTIVSFAEI